MKGLYIHIPFCEKKCRYCDFTSYTGILNMSEAYIDAVIRESADYQGEKASTVFIGGGTPSCLPDGLISKLIKGISENIDLSDITEFTVEANPNSLTEKKAEEYAACGADRISLGLQSSSPRLLRLLGRLHSPEQFTDAVRFAKAAGITNINADMMYSLPTQTVKEVADTAEFIMSHGVKHISAYSLILEEGTPLFDEHPVLPDEDTDREMFYVLKDKLEKNGFFRYEISNFAQKGYESKHNLIYWHVEDYIGLGVDAHSCINGRRYNNPDSLETYLSGVKHINEIPQEPETEKIMLGLRLSEGISTDQLPRTQKLDKLLKKMSENGLCFFKNDRLILTNKGMDIQNEILTEIFNAAEK